MSTSAAGNDVPTATQLLFARAVILTMELWPVMRLAVAEQWGGPESRDKRDFLVSHLCDEYSDEPSAVVQQAAVQAAGSGASSSANAVKAPAPKTPDMDDLAATFGMYFDDEFESRIEDGSADWVARRIVHLHKAIYAVFPPTQESLAQAQSEVDKLAEAAERLRGTKLSAQQNEGRVVEVGEDEDISDRGSDSDSNAGDAMDVDGENGGSSQQQRSTRPEPVVDDEGFTTVVKGRRR